MKCVICKQGERAPGLATVTLQRDETVVIVRGVPADICQDCGDITWKKRLHGRFTLRPKKL